MNIVVAVTQYNHEWVELDAEQKLGLWNSDPTLEFIASQLQAPAMKARHSFCKGHKDVVLPGDDKPLAGVSVGLVVNAMQNWQSLN